MATWIRVRDALTRHEFDVEESALRPGLERLDDPDRYPDLEGPGAVPRPAKPFVGKDGQPGTDGPESTATKHTKETSGRAAGITSEGVEL